MSVRWSATASWLLLGSVLVLAGSPTPAPQVPAPSETTERPVEETCALVWVGREAEFEAFLRTAEVTGMKSVPVGVTQPSRAYFAPGGLAESAAWKAVPPGIRNGFFESYRSEIAAYELDKLLGLHMVPPTVERRINRETGAAVLWASPTHSFTDLGGVPGQGSVPGPPSARVPEWTRQVVRAKMFDNLIGNSDPNLGNWLVDDDWHLILIDHSRSFTGTKTLVHKMDHIDRPLWEKVLALDEASLGAAIGPWTGRRELRAVLSRRDAMERQIARMVKERGDAVFLK